MEETVAQYFKNQLEDLVAGCGTRWASMNCLDLVSSKQEIMIAWRLQDNSETKKHIMDSGLFNQINLLEQSARLSGQYWTHLPGGLPSSLITGINHVREMKSPRNASRSLIAPAESRIFSNREE
jgi:hypothetical protein